MLLTYIADVGPWFYFQHCLFSCSINILKIFIWYLLHDVTEPFNCLFAKYDWYWPWNPYFVEHLTGLGSTHFADNGKKSCGPSAVSKPLQWYNFLGMQRDDWALRESVSRSSNRMSSFLSLMCLVPCGWLFLFSLFPFHSGASLTLLKEGKLPTHPIFLWCLALRCANLQAPNPGVIYNFHIWGRVPWKRKRETSGRNTDVSNRIWPGTLRPCQSSYLSVIGRSLYLCIYVFISLSTYLSMIYLSSTLKIELRTDKAVV